ncbi:hypothetical protein BU24DRAFT_128957 [Aaosphaeria arxii CBS 175.79]|uniref:RBR-type E3 ubiquitin transferase n=1 Tax=Aaosphaeria arxii CBS 175.79 TaxID=1450172 RepID=A0A6A5Y3R5_9PLEO|nr:uncharacterized protein BU24DRAFT_128957 [Aaosphaeria arxii CBS 175.79]KAF2019896.1 hypothetical protein BU24DRAFT_128957 [Aaosphaeria arxii CBS 175.79]
MQDGFSVLTRQGAATQATGNGQATKQPTSQPSSSALGTQEVRKAEVVPQMRDSTVPRQIASLQPTAAKQIVQPPVAPSASPASTVHGKGPVATKNPGALRENTAPHTAPAKQDDKPKFPQASSGVLKQVERLANDILVVVASAQKSPEKQPPSNSQETKVPGDATPRTALTGVSSPEDPKGIVNAGLAPHSTALQSGSASNVPDNMSIIKGAIDSPKNSSQQGLKDAKSPDGTGNPDGTDHPDDVARKRGGQEQHKDDSNKRTKLGDVGENKPYSLSSLHGSTTTKYVEGMCSVCREPVPVHKLLSTCKMPDEKDSHKYCRDCLEEWFKSSIADHEIFPPRCCSKTILPSDCEKYLTAETWVRFLEKKTEMETPNRAYCSNAACAKWVVPADIASDVARCRHCHQKTCTTCKTKQHQGLCPEDVNVKSLMEVAKVKKWKTCPRCSNMIELDVGCFHITCRCRHEFCYTCLAKWRTCKCPLWTEENIVNQPIPRPPPHQHQYERVFRDRGDTTCDTCNDVLAYIFRCTGCHFKVCRRCQG